ncbi:MAG: patatin family protein [Candidatus Binatia bacterium]|nr:MAG: patatin family protein [Candidatus Binatia bacterium]
MAVRLGVALSSGGAAGMAHVGVLEELEKHGFRVDVVAGTSAGALVGAAFCANGLRGFSDTMTRLTRGRVLRLFDFTWPYSGLLEGRRSLELVRPYLGERIETLFRTYAAIATDLYTGREVVLRRGPVLEAVRASAAIPGLFTPQRWQNRLLVDGGLVNPVPVDVVRQLGAERVLAVSVIPVPEESRRAEPPRSLSRLLLARFLSRHAGRTPEDEAELEPTRYGKDPGLVEILSRASAVIQSRIAAAKLRESPPDLLVRISLPEIGLFDFHRSKEAIEAGRKAAEKVLPEVRSLVRDRLVSIPRWKFPR